MTPNRAYLLRALNDWILDNQCTPYVVVDATLESVRVPEAYIKDGQIVLNINPSAVRHLQLSNDSVSFEARFGGQPQAVYVPIEAVTAIYAKENGRGMVFGWEVEPTDPGTSPESEDGAKAASKPSRPQLKVIK
ncbi:MAG: ClpXP protease specificity-enhancing factor [Pseudomonadales bacterium]|nr:ClpXP protease specificity-enhancing factor [Pseudomonadales bacterium]